MSDSPDPRIVREIARDCVADYIDDARDIAAHVMGHFGMGVPGDVYTWTDAVRTDLRAVVPSWPDEQPQDGGDVRAVADALDLIDGLWSGDARPGDVSLTRTALYERFADRIAALDARDAKGGGER